MNGGAVLSSADECSGGRGAVLLKLDLPLAVITESRAAALWSGLRVVLCAPDRAGP